ncbi:MAG: serine/threonine protein kinase [Betaproteobacteria bacterium]|nr:serine/threonine protein kinase [Betaproteobacteria bacterium]
MNTIPPAATNPSIPASPDARALETLVPRVLAASGSFSTAKWAAVVALSFVVLVGVAGWTYVAVSKSLRESRATGLTTLLNTQATAIQVWVEEKKRFAERWTANPLIGTYIERVVAEANSRADSTAFCQLPEAIELSRALQPFFKSEESVAYHVITPGGRIAASVAGGTCGRQIAGEEFFASLAPVFKGQTRFIRPYADGKALPRWTEAGPSRPVIWIEAPIRAADGAIIASLGFGKYADDQFSKILGVSRPGQTGEAYAFDEQPVLLSESRFRPTLAAVDKNAGMAMRQPVRDPGGDLLAGFSAASGERPLTRLASEATSSRGGSSAERRTGVLLEPYRNYRGATVVGAWTWLPEYDFGLALEMDAEEAYQPLRHVLNAFTALLAVLLLFAVLFGISSWSVLRLRLREARRVGQYTLEQQIGEGGISRVYLARHAHLKRPAAVKVLKMHLTTDEIVARFEREAQLCSQLTHPNTIEIFDYGRTRAGVSYYAMEYLRGATLAEIVEHTGPMPVGRVIHVLRHVCGSLGEAHEKGLVHRDVKPQNIMLCTQGGAYDVVKVVDFGLVKELRTASNRPSAIPADTPVGTPATPADLTQHSRVLGTPLYMAPERLRNPADADARADIYALAAVAFYLLSGRPIFENVADQALIEKVLNEPVRDVGSALGHDVPEALADLLAQCLEKDRALRPDSVAEFASVLEVVGHEWSWTEFDARRWWARHGDAVVRARPTFATKV